MGMKETNERLQVLVILTSKRLNMTYDRFWTREKEART